MPISRHFPRCALLACSVALAALPAAHAQDAPAPPAGEVPHDTVLAVELNRLEPVDGACRFYLVLTSTLEADLAALQLDLVAFGTDRLILGRMAVDLAPVPGEKETVRLFDWPDLACDRIGRVLLNDAPACATAEGPVERCLRRIETSAVGAVPLAR